MSFPAPRMKVVRMSPAQAEEVDVAVVHITYNIKLGCGIPQMQGSTWNEFRSIFSIFPKLILFIISNCRRAGDCSVNKTKILKLSIERVWLFLVLLLHWNSIFGITLPLLGWGPGSMNYPTLGWVTWALSPLHLQKSPGLIQKAVTFCEWCTCRNASCFVLLVTIWDQKKFRWEKGQQIIVNTTLLFIHSKIIWASHVPGAVIRTDQTTCFHGTYLLVGDIDNKQHRKVNFKKIYLQRKN